MAEITPGQRRRALRDLRIKLRLERRLRERWRVLQRDHARQVARAVASSTGLPDLAALTRNEGGPILRSHYGEVWDTFARDYSPQLDAGDRAALDEALAEIFAERAEAQAARIGETDAADAAAALSIAEAERERVSREEGTFLPLISVAAIAGTALLARMGARRTTIGAMETQTPAEVGKLALKRVEAVAPSLVLDAADRVFGLERAALIGRVALGTVTIGGLVAAGAMLLRDGGEADPTKTWVTVGDEVVRPHHAEASGQSVPSEEPFLVRGERLMYPGDSTLGAALDNVINCRCSAVYE